jgi:hypothetical protein
MKTKTKTKTKTRAQRPAPRSRRPLTLSALPLSALSLSALPLSALPLSALLTAALLMACEGGGGGGAGRGALLTGAAEEALPTGANLDELSPTLSLLPAQGQGAGAEGVGAEGVGAEGVGAEGVGAALTLHYFRRDGQVAPRAAELFVSYPAELSFVSARVGEALIVASKDLVVQTPRAGLLRVIVMSTGNLNTLSSGPLATLSWRGPSAALAAVRIQPRATYFAPADANLGVTLSPSDDAPHTTSAPSAARE